MNKRFSLLLSVVIILSVPMFPTESSAVDNIQRIREFMVDPPTLHCLGFRWYIYGDDNGDATVRVRYRKAGNTTWKEALPMLRVNREVANWDFRPYACENLLAGSIFNLTPDTGYEVRCSMLDPDGGEADTTVVVRTRAVPSVPQPLRTLHVITKPASGLKNSYTDLHEAVKDLKPGDMVLIHGGVHTIGPEGIRLETSGTKDHPIVFRGAGDGKAILQAEYNTTIFNLRDTNDVFFEDLTIRGGDTPYDEGKKRISQANDTYHLSHAFFAEGASRLTVRRCRIENVRMGFYSYSEHSENWYIADNIITGRNEAWYPRGHDNPSHTGVNIYGRGHIVCNNRISKFWDCIAIANYGKPPHDLDLQCVSIDFYNNDLSEAVDDGIEADYGCHNIRVFNNRIINAHTGLSAQPTYGGPIYFIRNELYNITSLSLKLHNWCTGLEIYHNTMISARGAFRSYARFQNATIRNNLFLGVSRYAVETGSPHPGTSLDYNGYYQAEPERFIKWYDGVDNVRYPDLAAFYEGTGFEKNGIMIDYDIFARATPPVEGTTYDQTFADLVLNAGAGPVDAGIVLPNINDDYTGNAPDIGCHERGKPRPRYGPGETN